LPSSSVSIVQPGGNAATGDITAWYEAEETGDRTPDELMGDIAGGRLDGERGDLGDSGVRGDRSARADEGDTIGNTNVPVSRAQLDGGGLVDVS